MMNAREFTIHDKEKLFEMIDEISNYDGNYEGLTNISNVNNYEEFLLKLDNNKYQERIKPDYSPQTTFGVFVNEQLVGGFNVRHILKGNLINHGGHIGYLIRPSMRGKGYGTKLLELALEEAFRLGIRRVLVTCRKENVASAKVIINNNGVYENDYYEENNNTVYERYWINL